MRFNRIVLLILLIAGCASVIIYAQLSGHADIVNVSAYVMIALCTLLIYIFYRSIIRPIRAIGNGMNLLSEQDFSSRLAPVGQRETDRIVDMFNAMMSSLKEERLTLREQNHLLDLLIKVSPMGIIILGQHREITQINNAAATFLGYARAEDAEGLTLADLDSSLGRVIAALRLNDTVTARLDNSSIYRCSCLAFMDKGYRHPYILIEALTDEVMLAERKSYEKVIRLIAHEVNNSMAGISSMLDTITMFAGEDGRDRTETEALRTCAQRCKSLSQFITSYSDVVKIPDPTPVRIDLNAFIGKISAMLESICGNLGVPISIKACDGEVYAHLDPVLFEQVLINIVKNAAESAASTRGSVTVEIISESENNHIHSSRESEQNAKSHHPVAGNVRTQNVTIAKSHRQVAGIVVTDSGAGIPTDVASRLFTPFFSTKPQGQGIGLLFVRDVLRSHNCRFTLRTDPDHLTRFTIRFPGSFRNNTTDT